MSRDTFHDLHHEHTADAQHIRLISEGGNSPHSPRPVCIDSIHVSDTCTTESQHPLYRSSTCAHRVLYPLDNALFSIPAEHADKLDGGLIPVVLAKRFAQQGIPLSDAAHLSVHRSGRTWHILDEGVRYSIRRLGSQLTVYGESE